MTPQTSHKTAVMQQDEETFSPAFVLQWEDSPESARAIAAKLAIDRNKRGKIWPQWIVNGIRY